MTEENKIVYGNLPFVFDNFFSFIKTRFLTFILMNMSLFL